jgi:hypothetical protein
MGGFTHSDVNALTWCHAAASPHRGDDSDRCEDVGHDITEGSHQLLFGFDHHSLFTVTHKPMQARHFMKHFLVDRNNICY